MYWITHRIRAVVELHSTHYTLFFAWKRPCLAQPIDIEFSSSRTIKYRHSFFRIQLWLGLICNWSCDFSLTSAESRQWKCGFLFFGIAACAYSWAQLLFGNVDSRMLTWDSTSNVWITRHNTQVCNLFSSFNIWLTISLTCSSSGGYNTGSFLSMRAF